MTKNNIFINKWKVIHLCLIEELFPQSKAKLITAVIWNRDPAHKNNNKINKMKWISLYVVFYFLLWKLADLGKRNLSGGNV